MDTLSSLARDFLAQKSIAVVGISSSKQTVANGVLKKLKSDGRKIYAVGKNTASFDNDVCYPDLASLPAAVDGVFAAASPDNIDRVLKDCIALKIPRLWIHNMSGTMNAAAVPPELRQRCRDHSIALIPGACPMMFVENADFGHKCFRWFLTAAGKMKVPTGSC